MDESNNNNTQLKGANTTELSPKSEKFLKSLIEEAFYLPGDTLDLNHIPSEQEIPWLDPKLIEKGKVWINKHRFSLFFAHFISLVVGCALKPGLTIMLRTGQSHRKEYSLIRYLLTSMHVKLWYDGTYNQTAKDLQKVRRLHSKAFQAYYTSPLPPPEETQLNERNAAILEAVVKDARSIPGPAEVLPAHLNSYTLPVPISQLGMVHTQFSFMGFVLLFPKVFGIHDNDTEGMAGFRHIWALLGKLIGIEDRFNLGLHADNDVLMSIFNQISVPGLKTSDEVTMTFWDTIITGVSAYTPFMNTNSILLFMLKDVVKVDSKHLHLDKVVSFYDKFLYWVLHILTSYVFQIGFFRWLTNVHHAYNLSRAERIYNAKL